MLHILNNSGSRLEVNALFLQPTYYCARHCKGCYVKVKAHEAKWNYKQVEVSEQIQLFRKFFEGEKAWANQITIAMDELPEYAVVQIGHNHLLRLFSAVIQTLTENQKEERPAVHLTLRSLDTLRAYVTQTTEAWGRLRFLDLISLSHIRDSDLDEMSRLNEAGLRFNYNHTCPTHLTSETIADQIEHLKAVGEVVDSIYMILFKKPLCSVPLSGVEDQRELSNMASSMRYINTILEAMPPKIRQKIHIDGCIQDAKNFLATGYGCSSNVSRFSVWPDGSVSGCAYALKSNTGPASTCDDIMANIRKAMTFYDFNHCKIPSLYNHTR